MLVHCRSSVWESRRCCLSCVGRAAGRSLEFHVQKDLLELLVRTSELFKLGRDSSPHGQKLHDKNSEAHWIPREPSLSRPYPTCRSSFGTLKAM